MRDRNVASRLPQKESVHLMRLHKKSFQEVMVVAGPCKIPNCRESRRKSRMIIETGNGADGRGGRTRALKDPPHAP